MTSEHQDFPDRLPTLLRSLADPTTIYTSLEIWSRVRGVGWDVCESTLLTELCSGTADVKRLILNVVREEAERVGPEAVRTFLPAISQSLDDDDRLVRMAAIHAAREMRAYDESIGSRLRQIICGNDPTLVHEALVTLLELDDRTIDEIVRLFRDRAETQKGGSTSLDSSSQSV